MFEIQDVQQSLLMFDLQTLKWINIGIFAVSPKNLFIDLDEVLTLHVSYHKGPDAFCRFPLRSGFKMMNNIRGVKEQ